MFTAVRSSLFCTLFLILAIIGAPSLHAQDDGTLLAGPLMALNTVQQVNGTANMPARDLLSPELKANPNTNPPPAVIEKLQIFEDLGNDLRKYNRVWTKVRTAQ